MPYFELYPKSVSLPLAIREEFNNHFVINVLPKLVFSGNSIEIDTEWGPLSVIGHSLDRKENGNISLEITKGYDDPWRDFFVERLLERVMTVVGFALDCPMEPLIRVLFGSVDSCSDEVTASLHAHPPSLNDQEVGRYAAIKAESSCLKPLIYRVIDSVEIINRRAKVPDFVWDSIAISVLLIEKQRYAEIRHLLMVTAVESLISKIIKFRKVPVNIHNKKNESPSFKDRILSVLDHLKIDYEDINGSGNISREIEHRIPSIGSMIYYRNRVTHGGYYADLHNVIELEEASLIARELISILIFSLLGYEGKYYSYVGGKHERYFPSRKQVT